MRVIQLSGRYTNSAFIDRGGPRRTGLFKRPGAARDLVIPTELYRALPQVKERSKTIPVIDREDL
jgi:hypothetical protein